MLSESILINRSGNFTASENHKLMAGWDKTKPPMPDMIEHEDYFKSLSKKPLVGELKDIDIIATGTQINDMWKWIQFHKPTQGLITYAQEKAMEELFYHDPSLNFSTVHTRNGEERELECVNKLAFETDLDFVNIGDEQKHISVDSVGATPDGLVMHKGKIITGCEVKCKSALVHAKNLLIENGHDLKSEEFEHFVQVQTHMLVTKTDHWYFANFNPFAKIESMEFKYVIIKRDDEFIKILESRLDIAKKIKADFLEKFSTFK